MNSNHLWDTKIGLCIGRWSLYKIDSNGAFGTQPSGLYREVVSNTEVKVHSNVAFGAQPSGLYREVASLYYYMGELAFTGLGKVSSIERGSFNHYYTTRGPKSHLGGKLSSMFGGV